MRGVHNFGNVDKWLVNLTSTNIPCDVLDFLSLGPGFCLPTSREDVNVGRLLMRMEGVLSCCPESCRDSLTAKGTNIITNFLLTDQSDTCLNNHLRGLFKKTKSFLRRNENIVVLTADKGAVTVLMDKDTYIDKGSEMLKDTHTYKIINKNPLQTLEKKTNSTLLKLKSQNFISDSLYQSLVTRNPILSKCYFLPKIHKDSVPLRPIISACGSATYRLSSYLASILSESLQHRTQYNVRDTFHFVNKVRDIRIPNNYVIVSLDVINLFTNISLDLVKSITTSHWDRIRDNCGFTLDAFLSTLDFVFDNTFFTFQNKIYLQTFGTPMGSPISPILAVMVMDHVLDGVVPGMPFDVPFIFKFVDDVITCVPRDKLDTVLTVFNNFDKNIQFTLEQETDNCIAFLDCMVVRGSEEGVLTDWYTKPSYSGRYINYHSSHTFSHKVNTIVGMKNRIHKICSPSFYNSSLEKLKTAFIKNGYPSRLVNRLLYSSSNYTKSIFDVPAPVKPTYLKLPSIPPINVKLKKIFDNSLPENTKIVFHYPHKIKNIFSKIKDEDELLYQTNVVYCLECDDCDAKYVGTTSQWLKKRVSLHKSDCHTRKMRCALSQHSLNLGHRFNFENVKVLDREPGYHGRMFLEMYYIKTTENTVNFKTDLENLSSIYSFIIDLDVGRSQLVDHNNSTLRF